MVAFIFLFCGWKIISIQPATLAPGFMLKILRRTEPKLIAVFLLLSGVIVRGCNVRNDGHDDYDEWWEFTADNIA
jgi:hypothetical protein